ncbi:ankyrin repeat and ELMO domain-containing protein D-like [Calliphora vicina]|uniref:ankyrin repeat and ELMO domain-containing protein D-like n=1 Tax=Calliphora vicina TaxID=7373 RepID=UPI00325A5040
MGPTQRSQVARSLRYCVNCLARTHVVAECDSSDTCLYCQQLHHTLLHPNRRSRTVHERLGERPSNSGSPIRSRMSVVRATTIRRIRSTTPGHNARNGNNSTRRRYTNQQNRTTNIRHHTIRHRNRNINRNMNHNNNNRNNTQPPAPNHHILSEAIRSLAVVLCASSSNQ